MSPLEWRLLNTHLAWLHDDVIKWKHLLRYWPFVRGIHRSPVNSLHKGQWRAALMFSLICTWINGCVNNCEAGDLRRHHAHYDVTVMWWWSTKESSSLIHQMGDSFTYELQKWDYLHYKRGISQCSKLLPVRQPEADNFRGGPGTF